MSEWTAGHPRHALSFDIEDYFHVFMFSEQISENEWVHCPYRASHSTMRLLDILDDCQCRATFFVLGWLARRQPKIAREITARGHEVASHGYWHRRVDQMSPEELSVELGDSRKALEDISGQHVSGYRAPSFSIPAQNEWYYRTLSEQGYTYSSSVNPIKHDHYGLVDANPLPHLRGHILELPMATLPVRSRNYPCAGGGFFRLLPLKLFQLIWNRMEHAGRKGIFYLHPWELDPGQPHLDGLSAKTRFRHYYGQSATERKLRRFLQSNSFGRIDQCFSSQFSKA